MLAGFVVAIWLILLYLRVPSTIVFFSLLVGQLLATQLGTETSDLISQYTNVPDFRYVLTALLVIPVLVTVLFLKGRVSPSRRIIEALPLLLCAMSLVIFIDNYYAFSSKLPQEQGQILETYESVIVSAGAVLSLVSAWLNYPKPHKSKHHKKH